MHTLVLSTINLPKKTEMCSLSLSKDMTGIQKLQMFHMIMTKTILGDVCHPSHILYMARQHRKFHRFQVAENSKMGHLTHTMPTSGYLVDLRLITL